MPHDWKNILVVTYDELIPAYFPSISAIKQACVRAKQRGYGIRRVQCGGNGHEPLIDFDSLPKHIQDAIGDPRKCNHILEKYYESLQEVSDFYTTYRYPDGDYVPKESLDMYITNGNMWRAIERLKTDREKERINKRGNMKGIMSSLCEDAASFNPVLKTKWGVEHSIPSAESRFKQRFKIYLESGLEGLLNKNKGNANAAVLNDETLALLNNMFGSQSHKPTYTEVANKYMGFLAGNVEVRNEITGEIYNTQEFRPLSRSTIYNYLSMWSNAIGTEAKRSGDRQVLAGKFRTPHSLNKPEHAGAIISIDDRQPPFEYAKGLRAWFYIGQDVASDAITTWVWGKSKEGIILDFYRQMVRNYAEWGLCLPAELECESSLNSSYKDGLLKEGNMFQYVRIEANNARGKYIEQGFNRKMRYGQEKENEGWIARPKARSESNQAGSEKVPMIPWNRLIERCLKDIEIWNNSPHIIHTDKTRWEVFMETQHPNLRPINYKAILPYLGYKTRTSCRTGVIKLQNREWLLGDDGEIYFGDQLIRLMQKIEGQNVDIYWLDGNDGDILKALVYYNGQLICEAIPKPSYARARIEWTDDDMKARELMSKYVATIDGYASRQKNTIDKVTIIDNTPVTLNNKFRITGVQHRSTFEENTDFDNTPEVLPEPEEELELIGVEMPFKTSLKDRF